MDTEMINDIVSQGIMLISAEKYDAAKLFARGYYCGSTTNNGSIYSSWKCMCKSWKVR